MAEAWLKKVADNDYVEPATDAGNHSESTQLRAHEQPGTELSAGSDISAVRPTIDNYGDLAAVIRLQSNELERLSRENERLMSHFASFLQLHEEEQRRRQELQDKFQRIVEQQAAHAPVPQHDTNDIRRAVRESTVGEIKPALVAILDLLERVLQRPSDVALEPVIQADRINAPESIPAPHNGVDQESATTSEPAAGLVTPALPIATEHTRLPDILTRPLDELTSDSAGTIRPVPTQARSEAVKKSAPADTQFSALHRKPSTERQSKKRPTLPGIFAWTNPFN